MKKQLMLFLVISFSLLALPKINFCQTNNSTLNLGILTSFEGYTGAGAITDAGASWAGDAGTNTGSITKGPGFTGTAYVADATTAQCKQDLLRLYIHLFNLFVTSTTHATTFGGETLSPGVYSIPSAGSLGGALILDAGNDANAKFVIKFNGAFSVTAAATITLINGAKSCNVFWIAEGAITSGAGANIQGTLISHTGAVTLDAGVTLVGRMFSFAGAIGTGASSMVSKPPNNSTIQVFCESSCTSSALNIFGSLQTFSVFTTSGAVTSGIITGTYGDVGSKSGGVLGFGDPSTTLIGAINDANAATTQGETDVNNAYATLMAMTATNITHSTTFGAAGAIGEVINAGVYDVGAAGLGGTLTLDASNNPDALFVFRIGGALSIAASSKMILINGTRRCNVFWIGGAGVATGAIGIGANADLKGTFLAHAAACTAGASTFLAGRLLSTAGAVDLAAGTIIYNNPGCVTSVAIAVVPVKLTYFTAVCNLKKIQLKWGSANEINLKNFVLERSIDQINWQVAGALAGEGSASGEHNYSFIDINALNGYKYFYRLSQNDFSGYSVYSEIVSVKNCGNNVAEDFTINPNPSTNKFTLLFTGDKNINVSYEIYNSIGKRVFQSYGFQSNFDVSNLNAGIYYLNINLKNKTITRKIVNVK